MRYCGSGSADGAAMTQSGLTFRLLGPLRIERNGEAIELPRSKKTRALLGYLAATGREHRRQRLTDLFWDVADDPRGGLRWCLSRLRGLIDEPERSRVIADRDCVRLDLTDADVDLHRIRAAKAGLGTVDAETAVELAGLFQGELLEGIDLPEFAEFQAWLTAARGDCRQLRIQVLTEIAARLSHNPELMLPFARDLVRLDSSNVQRWLYLLELLERTGRRREAEQQVEVGRRALTEQGIDDGVLVEAKRAMLGNPRSRLRSPRAKELRQEIRFCTSFDGTRIAYATVGEGPPIVKASNWLTHLEFDWESPVWRHVFTELSRDHRLIRYDERGNGLSDWDVEDISFDAFYRDLESVVDTLRLDRFALLGISKGASVSAAYAARHPDRVSHLILVGGFATGRLVEVSEQRRENEMAMRTLMRASWGADNPAFRHLFTGTFIPNATPDHVKWFNDLQRISASPDNALRLRIAAAEIDVRSLLPDIEAPTLVMHARGDAAVEYERGLALAGGIPNARFVTLESQNHLLTEDEPAWPKFLDEVRRFLAD
jgi:pimeloyl-ACP methyl ester carboxylesterase/DNA-binding SARP family transcriptional activator